MAERIITADEARRLREAATPGPWRVTNADSVAPRVGGAWPVAFIPGDHDDRPWDCGGDEPIEPLPLADAELIAAAPDLAWTVEQLTAERDEARRVLLALADALGCPVAHPDAMIASIRALREQVAGWISLGKSAGLRADRMTRERDEARATAQPAWTDLDAVRSIIRFECEECGIEFPPSDADVPAQLRHLLGGRDAMEVALKAERDRLARILAIERGDASQAPEGWSSNYAGDMWHRTRSGRTVWIHRFAQDDGVSLWEMRGVRRDDPRHRAWATALEAMEAIDAEVTRG